MMNGIGSFGYGSMGFGWIIWLILIGAVVWGVVALVNSNRNKNHYTHFSTGEDSFEILKRRYAKGEISKEQFEQMRKDIKF